jgi:DNA-directed RNA polymerase specialized sigma24 family protein
MRERDLTAESFDIFLNWLNPDREQAAWKHEAIRRRLIAFFDCRGCADAEGLADETINRVIKQITSLTTKFEGEPARYFYGVAHYVHLEYLERHVKRDGGPLTEAMRAPAFSTQDDERELRLACLDRCLQKLQPEEREMITEYYLEDKQAKIDHRRRLAERFGYSVNALRIKAHRLRGELYDCIMDCLRRQPKF